MVSSFAKQVAAARPRVMAVSRRLVGDDAEDVVQEATLRAFLSLSSLRDPDRFEAWLCGIAVNVAKMRLRRAATEARVLGSSRPDQVVLPGDERELLDVVRRALELLPPAKRDVVLLHYVDGLSCDEIAALVGSTPGAVRVRLHRARAQLRQELAVYAPSRPKKGETMIEMKLSDVLVRDAKGEPLKTVIVLEERSGDRRLPIWVGASEGMSLGFTLVGEEPQRPLSSDLMAELLRATGASVARVAIVDLRDGVFYGTVAVGDHEVDARPSDALNLAARTGAPILVAEHVLLAGERDVPGDGWSSVTADVLRAFHAPPPEE
jgi:RNA polymerase sigma factor (sigma-70 family)